MTFVRCIIDNLVSQRPSSDNSPGIDDAKSDSRIGANNVSATTSHQDASIVPGCHVVVLFSFLLMCGRSHSILSHLVTFGARSPWMLNRFALLNFCHQHYNTI